MKCRYPPEFVRIKKTPHEPMYWVEWLKWWPSAGWKWIKIEEQFSNRQDAVKYANTLEWTG